MSEVPKDYYPNLFIEQECKVFSVLPKYLQTLKESSSESILSIITAYNQRISRFLMKKLNQRACRNNAN